jgi:hypothetical protein
MKPKSLGESDKLGRTPWKIDESIHFNLRDNARRQVVSTAL